MTLRGSFLTASIFCIRIDLISLDFIKDTKYKVGRQQYQVHLKQKGDITYVGLSIGFCVVGKYSLGKRTRNQEILKNLVLSLRGKNK